jgi:hypothetical protein
MKTYFKSFMLLSVLILAAPLIAWICICPVIPCHGLSFMEIIKMGLWWRFIVSALSISLFVLVIGRLIIKVL